MAAAILMMAVCITIVDTSDESEATAAGTFKVYFSSNNGSTWSSQNVYANNASDAIMASQWKATGDSCVVFDSTPAGSYATLNTNYGDIIKFYGQENGLNDAYWNVFVYVNGSWTKANSGLGFYKCFDDYNINWRTANVALYYGDATTTVPSSLASMQTMISTTPVANQSAFLTTFHIKVTYSGATPIIDGTVEDADGVEIDADAIRSDEGVVIQGYGSDAYLALANAINSSTQTNVSGYMGVPQTGYYWYGWLTGLFGLDTVMTYEGDPDTWVDDRYAYWMIYETYSGTSSVTSHYNLGFLGATGAGVEDVDLYIYFNEGAM